MGWFGLVARTPRRAMFVRTHHPMPVAWGQSPRLAKGQDENVQKKQKLITAGIGAGAVAMAVALTGGTSAYFYDDEAQQAEFQSGSVDLVTTGAIDAVNVNPLASVTYDPATKTLSASNLRPGDSFDYNVVFTNAGSLEAFPYMAWTISGDEENGVNEAEGGPGAAGGELDDRMTVNYDIDAFGKTAGAQPVPVRSMLTNPVIGLSWPMAPGLARNAKFTFAVPNGGQGAENDVMTDSFDLQIKFALTQVGAPVPSL